MYIRYERDDKSVGYKKIFNDRSRARQSCKESCDVNYILDKYQRTGILPIMKNQKLYEDFADAPDYKAAMDLIVKAGEQFEGLDSTLRERFGNDPQKFLAFCNDPKNSDEMCDLGLATKIDDSFDQPVKVEVTNSVEPSPEEK